MKHKNSAFVISGIIMLLLVVIVCNLSIRWIRKGGPIVMTASQGELRNTIEIPLAQAADISIAYTSDNLKIYPAEGDRVIIKEYLSSKRENALADVNISDGKATVTGGDRLLPMSWFWFISCNERIEIYLPEEGLKKIEIGTHSGNITSKGGAVAASERAAVTAYSGNVRAEKVSAEEVIVETKSGNISADDIAGNAQIEAASGNVRIDRFSGEGKIQTHSGNVTVTDFAGYGEIGANSGNVTVKASQVAGTLSLSANSGNVKLVLPEELSFSLTADTGSGAIHTDFDEYLNYNKKQNHAEGIIGDASACEISAKAGSGNVSIRK